MTYLTEKQRDVLAYIGRTIAATGVAPTLQEIATQFGFRSTASAQKHVGLLEKKGFLTREKHQKRGLVLTRAEPEAPSSPFELPLYGVVAAGSPIESIPGDETISVPRDLAGSDTDFVLRVRGESMVDEGIHDGDLVIVHATSQAADGDMVVALVGDEVTLKRIYRQPGGRVRLQPSNGELAPLVVSAHDVTVQGTVVGLLRRY
jgi:repressor LexA